MVFIELDLAKKKKGLLFWFAPSPFKNESLMVFAFSLSLFLSLSLSLSFSVSLSLHTLSPSFSFPSKTTDKPLAIFTALHVTSSVYVYLNGSPIAVEVVPLRSPAGGKAAGHWNENKVRDEKRDDF